MASLYAIVDPDWCRGRDPAAVAAAAVRGGAAVVQYRWKGADDRPAEARRVVEAARAARRAGGPDVRVFINDRLDWALSAGADGVHIGLADLSVDEVRRRAPDLAIGLSSHTLDEAVAAAAAHPSYVSFGPVWPTATKADHAPPVGLDALRLVCERLAPGAVTAIGGVSTPERAAACARAGAAFVAVLSGISAAEDPEAGARAFAAALRAEAVPA